MELLQFLISFFLKNGGGEKFAPIFDLLQKNNFDVKNILSNLSFESIAPILESLNFNQNKSPQEDNSSYEQNSLSPISDFCDKDIVACLNNYFSVG